MIVGTTLLRLDGNPYYTPEFGRGGLAATFVVDVTQFALSVSETLGIEVETRNSEDTSWTSLGSFTAISAAGTAAKEVTAVKEIVRLKFTFSGTNATDGVHFLVQAPTWRPYA